MKKKRETENGIYKYQRVEYPIAHQEIHKIYNSVYLQEMGIAKAEYKKDQYDDHAIHFLAKANDEPVGYLRVIQPSWNGFPALELMKPDIDINLNNCVEFSRLQILHEHRKRTVGLRLMQEGLKTVVERNFENILIDVFTDGKFSTHELFRSIGFRECSSVYDDTRFVDVKCILMHFNMKDLWKLPLNMNMDPKYKPNLINFFITSLKSQAIEPIGVGAETDRHW